MVNTRFPIAGWFVPVLLACLLAAAAAYSNSAGRLIGSVASAGNAVRSPGTAPALAGMPTPEPLEFVPMERDRARLMNAAIPFAQSVGPAAKPFVILGSDDSKGRAIDCLASAMWYEAGNDAKGQQAVGQVVLNRLRHRSFPASVCGVVFQGSERRTGCQFTFTCDGALARRPSDTEFAAARSEARAMLEGTVDSAVGLATHYHTDWVHPAWSAQLVKLARVDTHLFFRWAGQGGDRSAMNKPYGGGEPVIPALAAVSAIHRMALPPGIEPGAAAMGGESSPALVATGASGSGSDTPGRPPGVFELIMSPTQGGARQSLAALDICGDRSFCKVLGRLQGQETGPIAFLFLRDRRTGVEKALWDCAIFQRSDRAQCLSAEDGRWTGFDGNLRPDAKVAAARVVAGLP